MKNIWLLRTEGRVNIPQDTTTGWKLQLYYPQIGIRKNEIYIKTDTGFRWVNYNDKTGGWAFGFNVIGFGLGIAWNGHKCEECNGLGVIIVNPENSNLNKICKSCDGNGAGKKEYK